MKKRPGSPISCADLATKLERAALNHRLHSFADEAGHIDDAARRLHELSTVSSELQHATWCPKLEKDNGDPCMCGLETLRRVLEGKS